VVDGWELMVDSPETGSLADEGADFPGSARSSVMACVKILVRSVITMPKVKKNIFNRALVFENQALGLVGLKC
jgi:hypothetical protein